MPKKENITENRRFFRQAERRQIPLGACDCLFSPVAGFCILFIEPDSRYGEHYHILHYD
jgi:hypothetical protein